MMDAVIDEVDGRMIRIGEKWLADVELQARQVSRSVDAAGELLVRIVSTGSRRLDPGRLGRLGRSAYAHVK